MMARGYTVRLERNPKEDRVAQPAPPCESVASRVETTVTMRHVTGNMMSVVKGMDKAMEAMNVHEPRACASLFLSLPLPPSSLLSIYLLPIRSPS
jgi:hypothetical protein